MMIISAASVEYVRARVRDQWADAALSGLTVEVAFVASGAPDEDDWVAASWNGTQVVGGETFYVVRVLVGPGADADPGEGDWQMWVRVTASPQVPVLPAGVLRVTP